jgi:hydroxymethylpyrimidine pyrophosphatase-like HAD family hydrolase
VHQGRKLYVLPAGLDKAAAVQHVAERVAGESGSAPLVLAAGDTELDWGMLQASSAGWVPAGSELDRSGLSAPHVTRTEHAGLAASEQIVAECLARVAAAGAGAADPAQPPRT